MKPFSRLIISIFVIFSIFSLKLQAQEQVSVSQRLYEDIKKNGFSGEKYFLCTEYQDYFQFNLRYDFGKDNGSRNHLILIFDQEDISQRLPFLLSLMEYYKAHESDFNVIVLLTAFDALDFPGNESMQGTEYFSQDLKGINNAGVIIVDFEAQKGNKIIPGSQGEVSPQYLTIPVSRLMEKEGIPFTIAGGFFISLYRIGILRDDSRLSSFLSKEIPALEINFLETEQGSQKILNLLQEFPERFKNTDTKRWSRHYIPLRLLNSRIIWLTERPLIIFLFAAAFLTLFILCDFSFIFRRLLTKKGAEKKAAIQTIYIIPATVLVQILALFSGQTVAGLITADRFANPMFMFALKLIIAFFIISFFYVIEIKFHKNAPALAYEYILTLSAVINIFLFSVIDISLMPIFVLEYVILFISRPAKKNIFLYLFLFIIILPFIPLVQSVMLNSDYRKLNNLIYTGFAENLVLAFALLPFNFMWLRILARFNFSSNKKRKLFVSYLIASSTCIVGLIIFSQISTLLLKKSLFNSIEIKSLTAKVQETGSHHLQDDVYDTEYYGSTIRHIELFSDREPLRYLIKIYSKNSNPVYYSTISTEQLMEATSFMLPDFPPPVFSLTYVPSTQEESSIVIEAYYEADTEILTSGITRRNILKESSVYRISDGRILHQDHK